MIGGPDSFGAGGWQDTPVEKALPVDCDIKSLKVPARVGWPWSSTPAKWPRQPLAKKIAKLAVKKLSPVDMVGVIY